MAQPVPARLSTAYTAAAGRKFGFTVGAAFAVLSGITYWRGHNRTFVVMASLGAALLLGALVAPRSLRVVEQGWMKLAHLISKVTTPIFMGVIYFVVLTPIALIRRAVGGSALVHQEGPTGLWLDKSKSRPSSLERLF